MTPQSRAHPLVTVLTRPAAQGARFADQLAGRFGDALRIIPSPLIAPVFLPVTLPAQEYGAVILTSETGAQAAGRLSGLPKLAFCVGDRTAQAAQAAGFDAVSAKGDADALVAAILSAGQSGPLLHLRGRESRGDVAARLTAQGLPTAEVETYAQEPQPLTPSARQALDGVDPVLLPLFSPRTAQLLAAERPKAPLLVAALSAAVADGLGDLSPHSLSVAKTPDAAAMLDAIVPLIPFRCA